MKESLPQTPQNENEKKPDLGNLGRRSFLKKSMLAAGALASGAVGGFAERKAEKIFEKPAGTAQQPAETEQPADPNQIKERYTRFSEAVEAGDQESIQFALEMIKYYSQELQKMMDEHTNLQKTLIQLPSGGKRDLLEIELHFNKERQEWLTNEIKNRRDPVDRYLRKLNQGESETDTAPTGTRKPEILA